MLLLRGHAVVADARSLFANVTFNCLPPRSDTAVGEGSNQLCKPGGCIGGLAKQEPLLMSSVGQEVSLIVMAHDTPDKPALELLVHGDC